MLFCIYIFFSSYIFQDNAPCTTGSPSSGNSFDWKTQNFTIYTNAQGVKTVESPFFNSSLTNPNVNEFSQYSLKDFQPADGWELIQYDFGNATIGTDVPYFILYNKHSGLMRVFVAFANLYGQNNAITLELRYVSNESRSALMENFSPNGLNATQNFNNEVPPVSINNFYVNQTLFWYHADFNLHYDPCICNYETSLELRAIVTNAANLQFTLQGQAIQNLNPPYGTDSYGRTGNIGNQSNGSNIISIMRNLGKGASWAQDLIVKGNPRLGISANKDSKLAAMFGTISSALPIVASVSQFLIGIFKDDPAPQPPRPLAFDINLQGSGTISSTYNYWYKELIAPGSEQTLLSATVRPFYNKAAGVFTLLKVPKVGYNIFYTYADEFNPERHELWENHMYKLKENISYTVNPHAGFDLSQSEITASLIFTNGSQRHETDLYGLGCLATIEQPFSYYRYDGWDGFYETGWVPGPNVKLQIVAKFRVAGTAIYVPYVALYNVSLEQDYALDPHGPEVLPSPGCSTSLPPATTSEIKAVCNSTLYKGLASEFARARSENDSQIEDSKGGIVYPNPVSNTLNVDLTKVKDNNLRLTIYDLNGKAIQTSNITAGRVNKIDMKHFTKGVYIVTVIGDNYNKNFKVVKL